MSVESWFSTGCMPMTACCPACVEHSVYFMIMHTAAREMLRDSSGHLVLSRILLVIEFITVALDGLNVAVL